MSRWFKNSTNKLVVWGKRKAYPKSSPKSSKIKIDDDPLPMDVLQLVNKGVLVEVFDAVDSTPPTPALPPAVVSEMETEAPPTEETPEPDASKLLTLAEFGDLSLSEMLQVLADLNLEPSNSRSKMQSRKDYAAFLKTQDA